MEFLCVRLKVWTVCESECGLEVRRILLSSEIKSGSCDCLASATERVKVESQRILTKTSPSILLLF